MPKPERYYDICKLWGGGRVDLGQCVNWSNMDEANLLESLQNLTITNVSKSEDSFGDGRLGGHF